MAIHIWQRIQHQYDRIADLNQCFCCSRHINGVTPKIFVFIIGINIHRIKASKNVKCNVEKTPHWWCSAREYVLPEPTVIFKMSNRSSNRSETLILPTGTCTVAEILVPESNHLFLACLDPKNEFSDTENNLFSGWPSHSFSYNKNTAKLQRGTKQQKMIGTAEIRRASDSTFFFGVCWCMG